MTVDETMKSVFDFLEIEADMKVDKTKNHCYTVVLIN
jgi:hypothetical protein